MRRLIAALLFAALPAMTLAHYYFVRTIMSPTSTTSAPVLGAPTMTTQWACVRADGTVNGALGLTQLAVETPCGTLVATDGITRYLEERVTTTRQQTTTTSTRRFELLGGSTLRVSDTHAQMLMRMPSGGGSAPTPEDPPAEASSACDGQPNLHYIRDGGTGDGTAWDNALDVLPASLQRGHSYYVADGSYASYTFDDAASGTTVINVCKATVADHGTETGWLDTYGDGQAVWGPLTISTVYLVFDGAIRNEDNWFDSAAYGFHVNDTAIGQNVILTASVAWSNITFKYTYFEGMTETTAGGIRAYTFDHVSPSNSNGPRPGLYISRIYAQYGANNVVLFSTDGAIVEYSAFADGWSNDPYHGEVINCYSFSADGQCRDAIIRWNHFRDAPGQTASVAIASSVGDGYLPNVEVYGNIFENMDTTDGMVGFLGSGSSDGDCTGCKFYNNTIVDGGAFNGSDGVQFPDGSGNDVRNNLWISPAGPSIDIGSGSTLTHNATNQGSVGTSSQTITTSIFVDYAGGDYRLATNTNAGVDLGAPYNTDMKGNTRTTWSRGALEYQP